ncbi:MAG: DUF72 domain-containing protein [Acidobacteria bacterium]|nr:MAG: DUF72 domain-containing protein [Acidobacteriota bacterium]
MQEQETRIGPAGWSYEDWKGTVYPEGSSKFDPLAYLADYFDTIEINSSFYRPPSASTAKSWVRRVTHNPRFKFTAKLHRTFTHERPTDTQKDEVEFRNGVDPLHEANRLGALLLQFPWSFKNIQQNREHLADLIGRFRVYLLVVEVRHSSWNKPEVLEWFEEKGVGFCNIDQPLFRHSIKPSGLATSRVGYVRLHGRNYENWFSENERPSDRYDYLYSLDELEPWVDRIKTVASQARETYVITNNHYRGKAVVNALDLKALLKGEKVRGPATLAEKYPHLKEIAVPE